jgi:hypothetical protein
MLLSFWRRLRNHGRTGAKGLRVSRPSYRPRLEPLEDRMLPAPLAGAAPPFPTTGHVWAAMPAAVPPTPLASNPAVGLTLLRVMAPMNAPPTTINMGAVFRSNVNLRPENGLHLEVLSNTNFALVGAELSGGALTLTYARGKCGTATITVCATDTGGVSVREAVVVMVGPSQVLSPGGVSRPTGLSMIPPHPR